MIGLLIEAGLRELCERVAQSRPARHIPKEEGTYLSRYFLYPRPCPEDLEGADRKSAGGAVLHHFRASDADHELHNHPWDWGLSLILTGGYREERRVHLRMHENLELPQELQKVLERVRHGILSRDFRPGSINFLRANTFHRIDLLDEQAGCWTLFIHGKRVQNWGFWNRFTDWYTPWREFVSKRGIPFSASGLEGNGAGQWPMQGLGVPNQSSLEDEAFEKELQ